MFFVGLWAVIICCLQQRRQFVQRGGFEGSLKGRAKGEGGGGSWAEQSKAEQSLEEVSVNTEKDGLYADQYVLIDMEKYVEWFTHSCNI